MKANELRIGNYILNHHKEIDTVTNHTFSKFRFPKMDGDYGVYPIELTEEWLLKFGFSDKEYKSGYIGKDFKSGGMILDFVLSKPFSKGEWNNTYTFDFEGHRFSKIEFVHELQNFYYCLTGVMLSLS